MKFWLIAFFFFGEYAGCNWSSGADLHVTPSNVPALSAAGRGVTEKSCASTLSPSSGRVFAPPVALIDQRSANSPVTLNPTVVRRPPVGLLHWLALRLKPDRLGRRRLLREH